MTEKTAVELIDRLATEGAPFIHCSEKPENILPDIDPIKVEIGIVASVYQKFLKQLRRESQSLPHVLAEEDKNAAIENLLGKPH